MKKILDEIITGLVGVLIIVFGFLYLKTSLLWGTTLIVCGAYVIIRDIIIIEVDLSKTLKERKDYERFLETATERAESEKNSIHSMKNAMMNISEEKKRLGKIICGIFVAIITILGIKLIYNIFKKNRK